MERSPMHIDAMPPNSPNYGDIECDGVAGLPFLLLSSLKYLANANFYYCGYYPARIIA
jgi:hypothetical protein